MKMQIVINSEFGGFGLSAEAFARYLDIKGIKYETQEKWWQKNIFFHEGHVGEDDYWLSEYDIGREDPALVQVVQELGEKANGPYSALKIVTIPDDVEYYIDEYDGMESIHENHRTWR
jgi:hypothetical protein